MLELRDKFTRNVKQEIQELKKAHSAELTRLKEEHESIVERLLEQRQKESSLKTQNADKTEKAIYGGTSGNSITEER